MNLPTHMILVLPYFFSCMTLILITTSSKYLSTTSFRLSTSNQNCHRHYQRFFQSSLSRNSFFSRLSYYNTKACSRSFVGTVANKVTQKLHPFSDRINTISTRRVIPTPAKSYIAFMLSSSSNNNFTTESDPNDERGYHTNNNNSKICSSTTTKPLIVIIAGPTGVGKSAVAAQLCTSPIASSIGNYGCGHIISADSVQAYKGVQIGANKPTVQERLQTPHHLIDIVDGTSICDYNAADWMRDALYVIEQLSKNENEDITTTTDHEDDDCNNAETANDTWSMQRRNEIKNYLITSLQLNNNNSSNNNMNKNNTKILPIVVGGTMMYLQWLVHGRPDAMRPSTEATKQAESIISQYKAMDKNDDPNTSSNDSDSDTSCNSLGWKDAVRHVNSFGSIFATQVSKLSGKDWYRLRRILEVAYTVREFQQGSSDTTSTTISSAENPNETLIQSLYNGQREGGLLSSGYDVRCFFLCPNDRMAHTKIVDERCEDMLLNGLLMETTELKLSGHLPTNSQQSRAIGYRQTLDYLLQRTSLIRNKTHNDDTATNHNEMNVKFPNEQDVITFGQYLEDFRTATRQYAKKQMQWFRRDKEFMFIPVNLMENDTSKRINDATEVIRQMCLMTREEYDRELNGVSSHFLIPNDNCITTSTSGGSTNEKNTKSGNETILFEKASKKSKVVVPKEVQTNTVMTLSSQTKLLNEQQGKKMKFYTPQRYKMKDNSPEMEQVLKEADECVEKLLS